MRVLAADAGRGGAGGLMRLGQGAEPKRQLAVAPGALCAASEWPCVLEPLASGGQGGKW